MKNSWWVSEDELIAEQVDVIDLPMEGSHLVLGPPGSGKTNLLLLRANYLTLAGTPNIAILVFTRALKEFIRAGASQYDFPAAKVKTHLGWEMSIIREYSKLPATLPSKFEDLRKAILQTLADTVASKKLQNIVDVALLDEAQDYWPEEVELIGKLAKQVFVVADSAQKIYGGDDSLDAISSLVDTTSVLKYHFRNGRKICRVADSLAKVRENYVPMEPTFQYNEAARPSSVNQHKCANVKEQIELLMPRIDLQLKTYPDELIGVLCPTHEIASEVWSAVSSSSFKKNAVWQKSDEGLVFSAETKVCVCTCHSAKGLEFRAVHVPGADEFRVLSQKTNVMFTTVTRAKTSLDFYHRGKLPSSLEGALATLEPVNDLPKVGQLFGGAKAKNASHDVGEE